MAGQGIRREQRLRRQSEFQALRKSGLSRAHPLVVLRAAPNALPYVRFGFVVSKRVSKLAVVRNRIRRRMREIVRRLPLGEGWDMLIIARTGAADAAFVDLRDAVERLASRLGIVAMTPRPNAAAEAGRGQDA